jgi:hypothetical protein
MNNKKTQSELDALLKSESQQTIRRVVNSLPEDSLSLSWRSNLNERLHQVRPQPRWRVRLAQAWKPAMGLALAGCLATLIAIKPGVQAPIQNSHPIEASLVRSYSDSANVDELVGPGLAVH